MKDDWGVEMGDRVLLCYLPGTSFVVAYWACLRLRVIAVPAYPPDPNKLAIGLKKLALVSKSCSARLCLTERALEQMRIALSLTHTWPQDLVWRRTDDLRIQQATLAVNDEIDAPIEGSAVAFLQYTSGSTGDPKGVMLTFANMFHNISEMYLPGQLRHLARRGVEHEWGADLASGRRVIGVSWLPQFHDTGLVLCIVAPFVAGYRMINFSPLTFLRSPLLWLKALSKYGVHWSAAPDFAYELCVRRLAETTDKKECPQFDLSSVRQFACGAGERCRPVQLARFLETFAAFGLRHDVYVPNYGLAEHVVGTCGCAGGIKVSKARPDLACCGEDFQCDLRIVCPVTRVEKAVGEPGEIWVSSMSVAAGYWGMPELTRKTFEARLANSKSSHCYLRTGDEGFFEEGPLGVQLYICGRLKDVIIVGGKNYYPEDIEVAVQEADRENIRPGCVAAFAAQDGGTATGDETVTCVFELRQQALKKFESAVALTSLCDKVSRAVGVTAGLQPARIVIIVERTIPKTTSGKVQRRQTRSLLYSHGLRVLHDTCGEHPTLSETSRSSSFSLLLSDNWLTKTVNQAFTMFSLAISSAPAQSETSPMLHATSQESHGEKVAPGDAHNLSSNAKHDAVHHTQPIKANGHAVDAEVAKTTDVLLSAVREVVSGPCTPSTAFHELGLSSRQTVELLRRVERDVDVELPPTLVFSCPTVGALALEICKLRRGDQVEDHPPEDEGIPDVPTVASPKRAALKVNSVAARLPGGCEDVAFGLRALINSRTETATAVPFLRWDIDAVNMHRAHSTALTRASYGAFCRGAIDFDPQKFGMGQAEASSLDPQQRLFLETAYEALYAGGYRKNAPSEPVSRRSLFAHATEEVRATEASLKTQTIPLVGANIAVCLGMMNMDAAFSIQPEDVGPHDLTGNGYSSAGSRLSFSFDMRGPCVVVDTACSASLVAGHAAARFVSTYEADSGLFAGTSLMLAPSFIHVGVAIAGMTSSTGRCHTFDAAADGYCRGEGSAVVVLGRSDEADVSRALRVTAAGFAIKHNGKSATFTALNSKAQTRLMEATPGARSTQAVEAHGTGTKLGDPIEVSGLAALRKAEPESKTLVSGVKANLGHTEPTAGNAGYLAALLVVASKASQPNARLYSANPVARFDRISGIVPASDTTPSGSKSSEFSIGVSSFGYSGIIAHAVILAAAAVAKYECEAFEPAMKFSEDKLSLTSPKFDDRVVLRRRGPTELDQLRRLGRRLTRKSAVPDPKHIWLLSKERNKSINAAFALNIKQRLWTERDRGISISSRLVEIALAVAQAIGAIHLVDLTIAVTRKHATRCIVEGSTIRIETEDGESALMVQISSTLAVPKPLRRCLVTKPPTRLSCSVHLSDEVGIAWELGNEEVRGLVVQSPHRMESPSLRAACLEAICQITSFLSSRHMEWTSIDEIYMPADVDVVSSRAWARIQTDGRKSAAKERTSVNCDVSTASRILALRGANFQQRRTVPARIEDVSVYEIGWYKAKKPVISKQKRSTVTVILKLTGKCPHANARASLLNNTFATAFARFPATRVVLLVSTDEHFAYSCSKGVNSMLATCSLPHGLQRAGWQEVDLISSQTLCSAKDELLETRMVPLVVAAHPSTYKHAACSGSILAVGCRPNVIVEVSAAHLLTLAVRAIGEFADAILLNTSRLRASSASHLSKLLRHRKPKILIGNGIVPAWSQGSLHSFYGDEVRVSFCTEGFGSPILDTSRISTGIYAGFAPQNSWVVQRRRLVGFRSIALLGPPSASAIRAGVVGTCVDGGAAMVAWAAAILTPSPDLHTKLLPRLHVDSLLLEGNSALQSGQLPKRHQQKASIKNVVNEVIEQILGHKVISTSNSKLSVDSLQGTEIAHELSNRLGREVPPILLSEADSVDDLVKALGGESNFEEEQEKTTSPSVSFDGGANFARTQKRILPTTFKCAESTPDQELLFWMSRGQQYFTWLPVTAIGDLIGNVDVEALKRAVNAVVRRHEALRSRLVKVQLDSDNDRTLFMVDDDDSRHPRLEVRDVGSAVEARRETQAFHDEYENNAFASKSPFRALLVRYPRISARANANGHQSSMNGVLYVSINHAVSDGWSQQLLYNDLVSAYNNDGYFPANRSEPARRYCDFLAWHNEEVARKLNEPAVVIQKENYASASRLPSQWPTLCPRDEVEDVLFASGSLLHNDLMATVAAPRVAALEAKLRSEAQNLGRASLPSVLLAAYLVALGDVKFGKAAAVQYSHSGRIGHPELAETYGQLATDMNVVVPATPTHIGAAKQLGTFIANVHKAVLHSLNLAFVPYSIAYRSASNGKRASLPPQYNWYDRYSDVPKWRGLEAKEISVDQTKMRLRTFNVGALYLMALVQSDGSLMMKLFYNSRVYARSTILVAIENIKKFIDVLITDGPGTPLASIDEARL